MCLIITAFAAVVTTIVWYFKANDKTIKLGVLALMYWGATIMWLVDAIYCVAEGEPFFDLSADDALLGLVIVLCGLVAWVVILLCSDPKKVFRTFQLKN
jgi:hypothetical protein